MYKICCFESPSVGLGTAGTPADAARDGQAIIFEFRVWMEIDTMADHRDGICETATAGGCQSISVVLG